MYAGEDDDDYYDDYDDEDDDDEDDDNDDDTHRVVVRAIKCFHSVRRTLKIKCRLLSSSLSSLSLPPPYNTEHVIEKADKLLTEKFIRPLVDKTHLTVLNRCNFGWPYINYFISSSISLHYHHHHLLCYCLLCFVMLIWCDFHNVLCCKYHDGHSTFIVFLSLFFIFL